MKVVYFAATFLAVLGQLGVHAISINSENSDHGVIQARSELAQSDIDSVAQPSEGGKKEKSKKSITIDEVKLRKTLGDMVKQIEDL